MQPGASSWQGPNTYCITALKQQQVTAFHFSERKTAKYVTTEKDSSSDSYQNRYKDQNNLSSKKAERTKPKNIVPLSLENSRVVTHCSTR
jgi:hypothetical protein